MAIQTESKKEAVLEDFTSLEEKIIRLDEKLSAMKEDKLSFKWIAETFLVPVSLAALSVFVGISSNTIAQAQTDNSKIQAEAEEKLGYLQVFLNEVSNSNQSNRQINALQLLYKMKPEIGKLLADAVQRNPDNSFEVRFAAARIDATLGAQKLKSILKGFRIVIICPSWQEARKKEASALETILKSNVGLGQVELHLENRAFFSPGRTPEGYEIRYSTSIENKQAEALRELLAFVTPQNNFNLIPVASHLSPGAITIFFPID